jgi:hypothetical protein
MKDEPKRTAPYSPEDWAKSGFNGDVKMAENYEPSKASLPHDATDRRDLQEKMRRHLELEVGPRIKDPDAPPPKFMTMAEEAEFLNRATAVSRGVAQQGDMVTLPNHYARFKIEPIRFIGENKLDWFQGNIVKYILRHDAKNGTEDIRKAIRYAEMYLVYLQGDPDWWKHGKPQDLTIGGPKS